MEQNQISRGIPDKIGRTRTPGGHERQAEKNTLGKRRRANRPTDQSVITLVTCSGCGVGSVTIRLSLDSVVVCQCTPRDAHYYINDYVSGGEVKFLGSFLTIGVTKGETQKERFKKNLAEEGGDSFIMLSPSMEELRLMFDDLSEEELNRRMDVVGHNPRLLNEMDGNEIFNGDIILDKDVYEIVTQAAREALGEDHPFFSWAIEKLMEELRTTKTSDMPLLSMFLEYVPSNIPSSSNANWFDEVSASRFMAFVHGKLIEHVKFSTDETLKAVVGRSGLGKCHAYDCHQFLLWMTANQTHLCWSATRNTWVPLVLGHITDKADDKRRIVHVR